MTGDPTGGSTDEERPARAQRVRIVPGGPILVEGPVEIDLPDGTRVRSDRPTVALCACRRSRRYPLCDTSHRRRARPSARSADSAQPATGSRNDDSPASHAPES